MCLPPHAVPCDGGGRFITAIVYRPGTSAVFGGHIGVAGGSGTTFKGDSLMHDVIQIENPQ